MILAGRDLEAGGTWLGISKSSSFRFAAVTNYREVSQHKTSKKRSRGDLVTGFLGSNLPASDFLIQEVQEHASKYAGFNLLVGDNPGLWYYSNRGNQNARKLERGRVYGLCNRLLDDPWPKVVRSRHDMSALMKDVATCESTKEEMPQRLFRMLRDTTKAPTKQLPKDTGHSQEVEKLFSSIFIKSDWYGTRSCTVLMARRKDSDDTFTCSFSERSFEAEGKFVGEVNEEFDAKSIMF